MDNGKLKDLSVRGLHIIPGVMFFSKKKFDKEDQVCDVSSINTRKKNRLKLILHNKKTTDFITNLSSVKSY